MVRGRTNETDEKIEGHLRDARRSIRAALETLQEDRNKSYRSRRTARDLRSLEDHTYRISSVGSGSSDPDLMAEDQRAEIRRQERAERRAAKKAEVNNG